jgi:hypothetical protein
MSNMFNISASLAINCLICRTELWNSGAEDVGGEECNFAELGNCPVAIILRSPRDPGIGESAFRSMYLSMSWDRNNRLEYLALLTSGGGHILVANP